MPITIREIETELQTLPVTERARLADMLLASLSEAPGTDIEARWADECQSRVQAFDAGRMKAVDANRVFAKLESRFNK